MAKKKIPSQFSFECALDLQAAKDDKSPPTFHINAYNGGPMQVNGFYDPVIVELSGVKTANKSIPILNNHDPDRIVGHSTSVTVSAKDIVVDGVVSGVGFHADEVVKSASNGFPWQASIGASVEKGLFLEEGEKTSVNGKEVKGPLVIAKSVLLREVSFVPLGADSSTSAKVAAECASLGVCTMKFEEFVASLGLELDKLTDEQTTALQAKFDAGITVEAASKSLKRTRKTVQPKTEEKPEEKTKEPVSPLQASREEIASDAERINAINACCTNDEFESVKNLGDLQAKAIREGWSVDKFELNCRREARPSAAAFTHRTSDDDRKKQATVLECAVARQCGNIPSDELVKMYGEEVVEASSKRSYDGAGVHMLFDHVIRAAGRSYSGSRKSTDFIVAAFEANRMIQANEGFSTLSVSQILENVANKQLISSYSAVEVTWPKFCAQHSMNDFKIHSRYRLDSEGSFRVVPSSGEIKHVSLADDKYTKQLDTYGAILSLNRQQIINDDLNAFMEIPQILGRMAAIRQEEAVYALLLSNPGDFFGAGNNNLLSGAESALDITSLSDGEELFMNQVDSNGKPILISPQVLLVPTSLKVEAEDLYAQTTVDQVLTGNEIARNPHKGKYPPVASPYINNTSITDQDGNEITGQTATQWYLFADPRVRAAIAIGFLNGRSAPVLESADTDFNTLGMQWRSYSDFGVGLEDPKAAVKATGTA